MERSGDGVTLEREHGYMPLEVKDKYASPEEKREDNPAFSVGKEVVVRQALGLTAGVN